MGGFFKGKKQPTIQQSVPVMDDYIEIPRELRGGHLNGFLTNQLKSFMEFGPSLQSLVHSNRI
jgi:hypothetical protein